MTTSITPSRATTPSPSLATTSTSGATALGVDVGGSSIRVGLVDVGTGALLDPRATDHTPLGAAPEDVADTIARLIDDAGHRVDTEVVGVCVPAVVSRGRTMSAANISPRWVGLDATELLEDRLGRPVRLLNDADAAGYAEARFGAARDTPGLVVMVTLGTGIGVAMLHDGVLIPNSELGHLEIDGVDWETKAATSAMHRDSLTWSEWAQRVQRYLDHLESLVHPDLLVIGGGVSSTPERFMPLLRTHAPLVAASMHDDAGLIGAAAFATRMRTTDDIRSDTEPKELR